MIPRLFQSRRGYIHLVIQAGLVMLAVRLVVIQCLQHDRWLTVARSMQDTRVTVKARRGLILDRRGRRLAVTVRSPSVFANPRAIPTARRHEVAAALSPILGSDEQEIFTRLDRAARCVRPRYFVWIKRRITPEQAEAVERLRLPGVGLRDETRRVYPNGTLLAHVIGFVGTDGCGLEGLEARFDALLSGKPGEEFVRRDGVGRLFDVSPVSRKPAVDGLSVQLTIDMRIQRIVEEELAAACEKHRPERACAVVMDPWTGDVLAIAGWPTFDPGCFRDVPAAVRRNMAVTECLEPGSTFKPFVAAAALERGVVTPRTVFNCHRGRYRIGRRVLHDAHGYGRLSVRDIVAFSSNIGMAQVGARLGRQQMYRALRRFGFGRRSGIELPGESAGLLRPPAAWSKLSISSIPMGQEIAVSPLQLVTAFCVFANGGWLVRPRIVLGVADSTGRYRLRTAGPPRCRRVLPGKVADLMGKDLLAAVVERGTGRRCAIPGYPMGGKTGTAQIARPGGGGYEPGAYCALFVGIVPVETPRFVIGLAARKPSGSSHYGGVVAGPAVSRIAERILSTYHVPRFMRMTRRRKAKARSG